MTSTQFVEMYHPALGNARASVSLSSVDDHAGRGWLLVGGDTPAVTPAAVRVVEAAAVVNPTGQWDFDLAPTVAGVPIGTGGGGSTTTSASALTSGTLTPARIADGSLPVAKLAVDVATQAELDAASTADRARANHTGTQPASSIGSGVLAPARLGTGTASASTVLYGDGTWKTAPSGGAGGFTPTAVPATQLAALLPQEWSAA